MFRKCARGIFLSMCRVRYFSSGMDVYLHFIPIPEGSKSRDSRKMDQLNAAVDLDDLKGFHSIRVNDQYRIAFRWTAEGPELIEVTDYH